MSEAETKLELSEQLKAPASWPTWYSPEDISGANIVIDFLVANKREQSWLARKARINPSTFNQVLRGKYPTSPTRFLSQARSVLVMDAERRTSREMPFVETSVAKIVFSVCHRARVYRNFGVVTANVGTGKTKAFKEYARLNPNTHLIEADPDMARSALLNALVNSTAATINSRQRYSHGTMQERLEAILDRLKDTDSLIILDEAETVQPSLLETLRRIRDKANIGIVLSGTKYLSSMIEREGGQFDQVRSRTGIWPAHIRGITREDSDQILGEAFSDIDALPSDLLDMFWIYGSGSARVLTESLIPAVRDYGIKRGTALTPALVKQVAREVLGLQPRLVKEIA